MSPGFLGHPEMSKPKQNWNDRSKCATRTEDMKRSPSFHLRNTSERTMAPFPWRARGTWGFDTRASTRDPELGFSSSQEVYTAPIDFCYFVVKSSETALQSRQASLAVQARLTCSASLVLGPQTWATAPGSIFIKYLFDFFLIFISFVCVCVCVCVHACAHFCRQMHTYGMAWVWNSKDNL